MLSFSQKLYKDEFSTRIFLNRAMDERQKFREDCAVLAMAPDGDIPLNWFELFGRHRSEDKKLGYYGPTLYIEDMYDIW